MSKFNPAEHVIDLKGKKYLPVAWRLVWFRTEHPTGSIQTDVISPAPNVLVKAVVTDGNGVILATAHAGVPDTSRPAVWVGREVEKAETAAIGRALAHAGFGTQYTTDEEGDFLADSPVERKAPPRPPQASESVSSPATPSNPQRPDGPPATPSDRTNDAGLNLDAFLRHATGQGLSEMAACLVLDVKAITDYEGTREEAAAALGAFVKAGDIGKHALAMGVQHNEARKVLGVEKYSAYSGTVEEAAAALDAYIAAQLPPAKAKSNGSGKALGAKSRLSALRDNSAGGNGNINAKQIQQLSIKLNDHNMNSKQDDEYILRYILANAFGVTSRKELNVKQFTELMLWLATDPDILLEEISNFAGWIALADQLEVKHDEDAIKEQEALA